MCQCFRCQKRLSSKLSSKGPESQSPWSSWSCQGTQFFAISGGVFWSTMGKFRKHPTLAMVDTQRVNYRELFKRIAMTVVWKKLTSSVHSGIVLKMLTRPWQLYFVNMSDEHMVWYMLSAIFTPDSTRWQRRLISTLPTNQVYYVYSPDAPCIEYLSIKLGHSLGFWCRYSMHGSHLGFWVTEMWNWKRASGSSPVPPKRDQRWSS